MQKLSILLACCISLSGSAQNFTVVITTNNATCGNATGTMSALVYGYPSYPYSILWSNGSTNWQLFALAPGATLTATVTDAVGATASSTATIQNQPNLYPGVGLSFAGSEPCENMCNGQGYLPLDDLGGIFPYSATYDGMPMYEENFGGPTALLTDEVCWNTQGLVHIEDATGCSVDIVSQPLYTVYTPYFQGITTENACTEPGSVTLQYFAPYGHSTLSLLDEEGLLVDEVYNPGYNNYHTFQSLTAGSYEAKLESYTGHFNSFTNEFGLITCTSVVQPFTIDGCLPPSSPFSSNVHPTYAKLNWTENDCALNYRIQYKPAGPSPWITKSATGAFRNITGLTANTPYLWRIRSRCGSNPNVWSAWSAVQSFTTPLREEEVSEDLRIQVYPNPLSTSFTVSISEEGNPALPAGRFDFILTNVFGREVLRSEILNQKYQIERGNLPAGVYFYKVVENEKMIGSGKVVIE